MLEQDSRIVVINHDYNRGVGGSIKSGFELFVNSDSDAMVIMAGDNQMNPAYLPSILDPLIKGTSDITKGNRLNQGLWYGMSSWRRLGNILLTYLSKFATGYYNVSDPQNGYVAATKDAIKSIDFRSLFERYAFENDFMVKANIVGLRMINVDIPANMGQKSQE